VPGVSDFRTKLAAVINGRIDYSGGFIDNSRVDQLVNDIETVIENNKLTVLSDVASDLSLLAGLPRPVTVTDEIRGSILANLREKGFMAKASDVQNVVAAVELILNRELGKAGK